MAKRVQIEIPKALARKARRAAQEEGASLREYVEHLVRRRLAEREEERQKAQEKARRRREAGRGLLDRAGEIEFRGDFGETHDEMRRGDPERA